VLPGGGGSVRLRCCAVQVLWAVDLLAPTTFVGLLLLYTVALLLAICIFGGRFVRIIAGSTVVDPANMAEPTGSPMLKVAQRVTTVVRWCGVGLFGLIGIGVAYVFVVQQPVAWLLMNAAMRLFDAVVIFSVILRSPSYSCY
jgi:hypothetical protein